MNYYSIFTGYHQDPLRSLLEPVPGIGKFRSAKDCRKVYSYQLLQTFKICYPWFWLLSPVLVRYSRERP
ncbi:MAG: hypothetical protein HWQ38_37595 [Nostoc sp. NMS7]|uniref:hypothetical protein n=1 Tax=Nostoc sp. NMS7 TaxID=2815391 RepID=UPI0025D5C3F1|nr:hypothetical protein [Nostoc sp. NMS7]MBN3951875.1 hypothetical protein [Nostoc sp. NMS7]